MGINLYLSPFENYTFYIAIFFHLGKKRASLGFFFSNECFNIVKVNNFLLQLLAFFSALQ